MMITKFHQKFPWLVEQLRNCNHGQIPRYPNPYHLEGDVWSHVCLVYAQAGNKLEQAVAFCHDLGKLHTRNFNVQTGRTSFYGHAGVSAWMSIGILRELGLSDELIIQAFKIISGHMDAHILNAEQLIKRYPYDMNFLYQLRKFGQMDSDGRITSIEGDNGPYFWDATNSRLKRSPQIDSKPSKTVELMVGIPCCGKSSYVNSQPSGDILSRDAMVLYQSGKISYSEAWKSCDQKKVDGLFQTRKEWLQKTSDHVLVDMTNLSLKGRRRILSGFEKWHKKAVVFLTPWEEIQRRNNNRVGKFISKEVYFRMMKSFSLPTYEQFDEIVFKI